MTEWKTLRVPKDAWQEAKAQKEQHNRTWGEQLVCSNDSTTEAGVVVDDATIHNLRDEILASINVECEGSYNGIDREALAEDRQEQLEEVVSAMCGDVATIEDIQDLVEEVRKTQALIERVPENTADELGSKYL